MSGLTLGAQRVDAARLDVFPCIRAVKTDNDDTHSLITRLIDR